MNAFQKAVVVLLLSSATAMAAPASESSIKQLLDVTQAQQLLHGVRAQLDSLMNNAVQQALKGRTPTAGQQQVITNMQNKMVALLQAELAWAKLEPMYLRLYKEAFSEEEIADMLSFYKTPAGQAVVHKMPVLMRKTMLEIQKMTSGLTPKMQQIQEDFVAEMTAASK
jgi:uncharacterized protein